MGKLFRLGALLCLLVLAPLSTAPLSLAQVPGEELPASIVTIASGDTLLVEVFVSPYQRVRFPVCLEGVDTPDLNARCYSERLISQEAINMVRDLSYGGVTLFDMEPGCYPNRPFARIRLRDGRELSDVLLDAGVGAPYEPGQFARWCHEDDSLTHPGSGIYTYY